GPDIVSRGFVYVREAEKLMDEARKIVRQSVFECLEKRYKDWGTIKSRVKEDLSEYVYQSTKRSPMILPIIMEV
ncbi:MAG: ribonuclease J, partial [Oscillospiraceae bacterium]|nr:ribonuclease J [Oscillospiraceae bacterium]